MTIYMNLGHALQTKYANDSLTVWHISDLRFMKKLIVSDSWEHLQNKRLWKPEVKTNHSPMSGAFVQSGTREDHADVINIGEHLSIIYSLLEMTSDTSKCVLSLDHNEGSENRGLALRGYTEP